MIYRKVFITPTTHWDREWVMSLGQFQVRLVNLIDNLMSIFDRNPEYCFLMDGQSIALEDYLEIKPEQRGRIAEYLRNGQLAAGPWYVLADQFLQNGESTIRNLIIGMETVKELDGNPMMLGYVPDSFGSIASLPMILKGFNINYATFGRGRPFWGEVLPHAEFWWEGPDGSRVLAVNHGYGNGLFLSYMDIWTDIFTSVSFNPDPGNVLSKFFEEVKNQEDKAATSNLYFSVGVDHMEPRESLPGIIKYINQNQNQYELIYGLPVDYLKAVEKDAENLHSYIGEMRGSDENPMNLVGTLSSRISLKQANDNCELLLQRVIEPLWSMVSTLAGIKYPGGHLRKLWKLLLSNQPHDSICGCSVDQVHKDMMNRFEQIQEIGSYLVKDGLHELVSKIDTTNPSKEAVALTVVNPLGYDYTGPVKGLIRVPRRFKYDSYVLIDAENKAIPAHIRHITDKVKDLESVYMTNQQLSIVISKGAGAERPDDQVFSILETDFIVEDVPGSGYKTLWLKPGVSENSFLPGLRLNDRGMENEWLKVDLNNDGTIDMEDKRTGYRYSGLNYFVDREDIGNTYDYHGFPEPEEVQSNINTANWSVYSIEPHCIVYRSILSMELPEGIDGCKRSTHLKQITIILLATLYAGIPRLDISVELNNKCKDHCLRVVFDTTINSDKVSVYDHFNILEREVRSQKAEWRDEPFQEFIDISDGVHGLCISTKGLPAYEAVKRDKGTCLYLTLLRSVGELGVPAGANYPVSEAQCQGSHRYEYSIIPHKGNWVDGECLKKAVDYRSPLLLEADFLHDGLLPSTGSFISVSSEKDVKPFVSCIKQAEDGNGLILRLWNPGETEKIELKSDFKIKDIKLTSLDEINKDITIDSKKRICLKARGLTTIRVMI